MRKVFQQELQEVQEALVKIAGLVELSIQRGVRAFGRSNVELAEKVISDESLIDELATAVDDKAVSIMVRQQPVASDLRQMVAALRISNSLERMADLAEHIALLARYRFPEPVVPSSLVPTFQRMGELDIQIAGLVRELIDTQDLELIEKIHATDDEIDALHAGVFDQILSENFDGDHGSVIDVTLASRYHERFGDHAISIAKRVYYLVEGGELSPRSQTSGN